MEENYDGFPMPWLTDSGYSAWICGEHVRCVNGLAVKLGVGGYAMDVRPFEVYVEDEQWRIGGELTICTRCSGYGHTACPTHGLSKPHEVCQHLKMEKHDD